MSLQYAVCVYYGLKSLALPSHLLLLLLVLLPRLSLPSSSKSSLNISGIIDPTFLVRLHHTFTNLWCGLSLRLSSWCGILIWFLQPLGLLLTHECFKWFGNWGTQLLQWAIMRDSNINPLNPELNPICYLLALLGAHHFPHVSRIMVKLLTLRRLMSYIYGSSILDVSRSHTTTQHSR